MKYGEFSGKKITIMGLGLLGGGVGTVRFFCNAGAQVTVTDLKTRKELRESIIKLKKYKIKYILGGHRAEDFKNTDLVVYGPGVRSDSEYLQMAKKNKIRIATDIGIFFELCPYKIIGITGTKGKSTMTTLVYALLKSCYQNVFMGGNIQKSVFDILPKLKKDSIVVLELSSWQIEGLIAVQKSPNIAVITNILPDHLNTYKNFNEYAKTKKSIYKYQKAGDKKILNYDDKTLRSVSAVKDTGDTIFYSLDKKLPKSPVYVDNDEIIYKGKVVCHTKELKVRGAHNLRHILGALTAISDYEIPFKKIRETVINFKGIFGRLEFIRKKNEVEYYNDTTATNPDAVIAALQSFPCDKNIILIFGGVDKNLNSYGKLAKEIKKSVKGLVLLSGTATEKLIKELNFYKISAPVIKTKNMKEAVLIAKNESRGNDIIILSPGGSSFNLFKNEFDRGEQFVNAVNGL